MVVIFKIPWLMTFSYLQTDCLTPCQHHVKAHANQLHPVWGKNTNNKRFLQGKNSHLYCLAHWCEILDCSWNALGKLMQIQKQISVSGNCYIFCYRECEFVERGSRLKGIPAGQEMYSKKNCPHLHPASSIKNQRNMLCCPALMLLREDLI